MRLATGIFLAVLTGTVGTATAEAIDPDADPEPEQPEVEPFRRFSAAIYFAGHGGAINGVNEGGMGPGAEVALGSGRKQLFVEGALAWLTAGVAPDYTRGFMVRGGVGARWIARSFDIERDGGIEMIFDGVVGAQKMWWDDVTIVRPEISGGVGLQVRKYRTPGFAIRFTIRVFFAPTDDVIPMKTAARCQKPCEQTTPSHTNGGIMFAIGGGL